MIEINGKYFVSIISKRLNYEKILAYDSNIVNKIRELNKYQLLQLVTMGDVAEWHNDEINKGK